MASVAVRINNREYSVACADGEERRIEQLGTFVDSKVRELSDSLGNLGDQRLLVMVSPVLADELWELRENAGSSPSDEQDRSAAIDGLAKRLDALAARLEST